MTVEPTVDVEYCDRVLRELWAENWFDGCRPVEGVTYRGAVGRDGHLFLRIRMGATDGGLFRFEERAPGLWECHSQLLKSCRGLEAIQAYELGLGYMFRKMKAQRLDGFAPRYQRHAVWLAVRLGFVIERRREEQMAVRRAGKEFEVTRYCMTRKRWAERRPRERK